MLFYTIVKRTELTRVILRKLVNKGLKEKLTYEAQNLNLLNVDKVPQLPI